MSILWPPHTLRYTRHQLWKQRRQIYTVLSSICTSVLPSQKVSNGENVFIWWRHHGTRLTLCFVLLCLGNDWFYPSSIGLLHWHWDNWLIAQCQHYNDVIMSAMASQITNLMIVYSTFYSGADQRKLQSTASLAFVRGIHRWPVIPFINTHYINQYQNKSIDAQLHSRKTVGCSFKPPLKLEMDE